MAGLVPTHRPVLQVGANAFGEIVETLEFVKEIDDPHDPEETGGCQGR